MKDIYQAESAEEAQKITGFLKKLGSHKPEQFECQYEFIRFKSENGKNTPQWEFEALLNCIKGIRLVINP